MSLTKTVRRSAGFSSAKPLKIGDLTHLPTAIVAGGQFLNTSNVMLGAFCKKNLDSPVGLISDKTRPIFHEFSKDLFTHGAFKNEGASGKGIFTTPPKGKFYRIEGDVVEYRPQENKLVLQDREFTYDHLVLASELLFDLTTVVGLEAALKDYWNSHVLSNAQLPFNGNIDRASRNFRGGNFIYNLPSAPCKNEGTNHLFAFFDSLKADKLTYTQWAESKFFVTSPDAYLHRVPYVNAILLGEAKKRGIEVLLNHKLVEIKYNKVLDYYRVEDAIYKNTQTGDSVVLPYGQLVTYPDGKVPAVLKPFLNSSGLVSVDSHTLQHTEFPNVFALGETTTLPTISNCIAQCNQAQTVAYNLHYAKQNMPLKSKYDGTSATPIFTGMGKLIMPGFDYSGNEVSTKLTTDTSSSLAGLKQSLSFKLFKHFEKKWFEKRLKGKIYGPPSWTKQATPKAADTKPATS
jgi:sulfide:quinone oxidoreductase